MLGPISFRSIKDRRLLKILSQIILWEIVLAHLEKLVHTAHEIEQHGIAIPVVISILRVKNR